MPRTGLAYEDVAYAMHALEKAGVAPSIRLIREKLGRGSLSTIAEHKRAVEAERAEGPTEALPDPIAKGLLKGARAFWQELVEAAEAEIASVKKQHDEQLAEANTALEQALEKVACAKDELGSSQARVAELEQALTERDATLEAADAARQGLEQDVATLKATHAALGAERDALKTELAQSRKATTEATAERSALSERLERQAAEFAKDKATLQEHFNEYKDRLATLSDEARRANRARRNAENAAAATEEKASASEREIQRLNSELVDARDEIRVLTDKLGEVRGELEALRQADKERLADRDAQLEASAKALEEAQTLVRQYVEADRSLVQELIDERRSARKRG